MSFFHSLRFRLGAMMILLLTIPLLFNGFTAYQSSKVLEYAVIQKSEMEKISGRFKDIFNDYETLLHNISEMKEIQSESYQVPSQAGYKITNMPSVNDPDKTTFYQSFLTEIESKNTYALNMYFATDEKGELYLSNIPPSEVNLNDFDPRQREWYLNAKSANGEVIWTTPYIDTGTGKSTITLAKALKNENGKITGVIGIDFDMYQMAVLMRYDLLKSTLIIAFVSILVGLVVVLLFMKKFNANLQKVQYGISKVAAGDLAFERPTVQSKDELGQLIHQFNAMVDNLEELVSNVIDTSQQVAASAEQLNANADEVQEVASSTQEQSASIQEVSFATRELANMAQELHEVGRKFNK